MEALKQNYSYDIILMQSNYLRKNDEQILAYKVRLFDEFIVLPERRLFTNRFPSSPLGEVEKSPCEMIGLLNEKGVCVTLYEDTELLGCGAVRLSSDLLKKLAERTFTVKEVLTVPLIAGKKTVATVELKVKFSSADPELDLRLLPFGCYDVCRPTDKSVDPHDVVLTLGRSATGGVTSCITDKRLMSHPGPPFSCVRATGGTHGKECACKLKGIDRRSGIDQAKERERKLLKKLLIDLDIDRVHVPTPPSEFTKAGLCQCYKPGSSDSSSLDLMDDWSESEENEAKLDLQELSSAIGLSLRQQQELQNLRMRSLGICPKLELPKLKTEKYRPPLICPVCRANITWLPKLSACPYCGYKRFEVEVPSEEPFDETLTAAEVLRNHLLNTRLNDAEDKKTTNDLCEAGNIPDMTKECTCSSQRICTRCRIKELSAQMFKMTSKLNIPLPIAAAPEIQDNSKELKESPSQNRKKLHQIFTELHNQLGDKKKDGPDDILKNACANASKKKGKRRRVTKAFKKAMQELEQSMPAKKPQIKKKVVRRLRSKRYTILDCREDGRPKNRHKSCARDCGRVPCDMGWMWTKSELARHRSWKPGAITKPIRQLMAYFLKDYPADVINTTRFHFRKRRLPNPENDEPLVQHPTLQITKKHGEYVITMRPLKDPETLAKSANPFANMNPVVFRITKDPIATGKRNMKIALKDKNYPVCTCHMPITECFCRSLVDKKIVEEEVRNLCDEIGWEDITDTFVYSDLSEDDSEEEYDFGVTPPAGVIKPERRRKPDRVNCETQYNENDWAMPTMYPHPPNALVQYGGCVVGERRGRFDWLFGKGYVHAEPPPPKMRNKSKPKPKRPFPGAPMPTDSPRQKGGCDVSNSKISFSNVLYDRPSWHKSNQRAPFHLNIGQVR